MFNLTPTPNFIYEILESYTSLILYGLPELMDICPSLLRPRRWVIVSSQYPTQNKTLHRIRIKRFTLKR